MYKVLPVILLGAFMVCCESDTGIRSYEREVSAREGSIQESNETNAPPSGVLTWEAPKGWQENRESGIRLTSFITEPENRRGLCTVVILKGDGGGLRANVQRWMAQLDLLPASGDIPNGFLSGQKKFNTGGGFPARFIDFTSLGDSGDSTSMLVTMISLPDETLFVKMVEKKQFLIQRRDGFLALCQSFKYLPRQDENK